MAGRSVAEGIGTHSESVIEYRLPVGFTRFKARGGLDAGGVSQGHGATVHFLVFTVDPRRHPTGERVAVTFPALGLEGTCRLRELWSGRDLGEFTGQFGVEIPDHAAGLLRVAPQAGR